MKILTVLLISVLLTGCGTNQGSFSNKKALKSVALENKTMVLCLSPLNEFRAPFETEMKKQLEFHNLYTETSENYLPFTLTKTTSTVKKIAKFIESLPEKGFNQVFLSALANVENVSINDQGEYGDFKLYHFETKLYTLGGVDSTLIWSMCLCIYDYQFVELTTKDIAHAIISKLIEDDIIQDNEIHYVELYDL